MKGQETEKPILERCVWPPLSAPYAAALREAVAYVLSRYDVLAVAVSGTILRGHPDPSSDLDMVVLHRPSTRQRIQKRFQGVPTEIFVNPPHMYDRYFDVEATRPMMAHMLATAFVIYAGDPVIHRLREQAAELLRNGPTYTEETLTRARYTAATWYEDALDVVKKDPATAQMLLTLAVFHMLQFYFQQNRRYVPRYKELLAAIAASDAELGHWARAFFETADLSMRLELAAYIADRTIGVDGFFEWESALESV